MSPQNITVRRAKPRDAEKIAAFVNRAWRGRRTIDRMKVLERLGSVGFFLAERDGELVGMLGWRAENLVVRVTDFLVGAVSDRVAIGNALLREMEKAANELQCEAALLFLPRPAPQSLKNFYATLGYTERVVSTLPKDWQEAAREARLSDNDTIMVKQLRERIYRPI